MASELQLQNKLELFLGSTNVYFQPPESVKMEYPCIVYKLGGIPVNKADNTVYKFNTYYEVTLIHKDPDNELKDKILKYFKYCSFDRFYIADNLNHYVYRLYF